MWAHTLRHCIPSIFNALTHFPDTLVSPLPRIKTHLLLEKSPKEFSLVFKTKKLNVKWTTDGKQMKIATSIGSKKGLTSTITHGSAWFTAGSITYCIQHWHIVGHTSKPPRSFTVAHENLQHSECTLTLLLTSGASISKCGTFSMHSRNLYFAPSWDIFRRKRWGPFWPIRHY